MTQAAEIVSGPPAVKIRGHKLWKRRARRAAFTCLTLWMSTVAVWETALRMIPMTESPRYPRPATVIQDRNGRELAAFVGQEDAWYLPLRPHQISPYLKQALIAVEDRRFAQHHGVDWLSVLGAAYEDLVALKIRRGASTLSMQVVHLRDRRARGWLNKLEQAFQAEQLELHATKDEILTEYLNRAPFGGNLVGAGAASWRYFGKPCRELSLGQAALLAGLPQSPNRFRPDRAPEEALKRRAHVLEQMLASQVISAEEFTRASAEPVDASWRPLPQESTRQAWGALPTLTDVAGGQSGNSIQTTIDAGTQETAWRALHEQLAGLAAGGIDSGAVVVVDVGSGDLLACVSSSIASPSIDLTRTPRSSGSILKPFIYAAAFDLGILSADTEVLDAPQAWAGYVPSNFDKGFRGKITAGEALAESRNIPAMMVLAKLGPSRALNTMEEMGVRTPGQSGRLYGLSLAIGGAEASPREIAEGYATLARGGLHLPLHLLTAHEKPARALPELACWQTLASLSNRARTESIDGAADSASLSVAWKTGTSNGFRDAWCAAATLRTVVVVWLGNSSARGNAELVGLQAAAPLALHLIGMLDKGGESWPTLPVRAAMKQLEPNLQLSVISPKSGTEILANTDEPPKLALKCAGGKGTQRWWFANGALVGQAQGGQVVWWKPHPGKFELRVVDEAGSGSLVHVSVR